MSINRFSRLIILTGHRKSGTSVFHKLFDGHTNLYVFPVDIGVLYGYFPAFTIKLKNDPKSLRARLNLVLRNSLESVGFDKVPDFLRDINKSLEDSELTNKARVIATIANAWIKTNYGENDTLKPFLFKETSQAIFLQEFKGIDSSTMMINLIRDPRDNFAAIKDGIESYYSKMGEGLNESLASVVNRVKVDLESAKINSLNNPNVFVPIKFEDLVKDPRKTMQRICGFLKISFQDTLLTPTVLGEVYKGNNHKKVEFNGISAQNVGRWKERLNRYEISVLNFYLSDSINYWDYEKVQATEIDIGDVSKFYKWYNTKYFYKDSFKI